MIEITGVEKAYQMGGTTVRALSGVTLRIVAGDFVAIMGPSGSGKSTLMHILGLLDVPDAGSYKLFGDEVSGLSEDQLATLRSRTIGFVFQQFNLLARTSAEENVALPMIYAEGRLDLGWARELLAKVGLEKRSDHRPNELSGGQQQRVAIARALVNRPRILFADEPTGNLDSASEKEIMAILAELNSQGITVVIVTHEPEIARYVKRVIRMRDGVVQSDEAAPGLAPVATLAARAPDAARPSATTPAPGAARTARGPGASWRALTAHFRQAGRSLLANKARSALSMLGILIGVAAVITMLALGAGASDSIRQQLSSLGSNLLILRPGGRRSGGVSLGAGAVTRMTLEDAGEIRTGLASVKYVSPSVSGRAQVVFKDKNWNTQVNGVGTAYAPMHTAVPIIGRFFTSAENRQRARVAVIGATVDRELFGDQNPVGESIMINRITFQVIGVLPVKGATGWADQDDLIVIPINTAMRRLLGKTYVDSIDIEATDAASMDDLQTRVVSLMLRRHHLPDTNDEAFRVRNMADIQQAMSQTSKVMGLLLAAIASISLLVGGIGIMNIMLVSVTERTREIGLRKAVGASRGSIQAQFLVEAIVVSFIGGAVGIALGVGTAESLAIFVGWAVRVSIQSVVLAAVFSAGIGVIFGYWPARKASALHPIDALRHE